MLKFLLGKELVSQLSASFEKSLSLQLQKVVDDIKRLIDEKKISFDPNKIDTEKEKLALEKDKFAFEKDKFAFEKEHKKASYKYPAHVRGVYSMFSAIGVASITAFYFKDKEKSLEEKDRELESKESSNKRKQILEQTMKKIESECWDDCCKKNILTKKSIECVEQCKKESDDYQKAVKFLSEKNVGVGEIKPESNCSPQVTSRLDNGIQARQSCEDVESALGFRLLPE